MVCCSVGRLIPLTMPAGVTWPCYLRFFSAAMLSMFAGAQVVHHFYRPLDDIDEWIDKAKTKRTQDSIKIVKLEKD